MEPLMKEKRQAASLIPYRNDGERYEFYLQKRDVNAKSNPGIYGLFGGGFESGEDAVAAMTREISEELAYAPIHPIYFSRYESATSIIHTFFEEVSGNFENTVTVHEGEYGKFLTLSEILYSREVSLFAQLVVFHYCRDILKVKINGYG